jgi:holo-[acyl-carrier protein] synthase
MIVGIGIDSVDIERLASWHLYPTTQLRKIFTQDELTYAVSIPEKQTERLAARFAVKEAFFKAYSSWHKQHAIPFLTLCRLIELRAADRTAPHLYVAWNKLQTTIPTGPQNIPTCHVSITHTASQATALVIIEICK